MRRSPIFHIAGKPLLCETYGRYTKKRRYMYVTSTLCMERELVKQYGMEDIWNLSKAWIYPQ